MSGFMLVLDLMLQAQQRDPAGADAVAAFYVNDDGPLVPVGDLVAHRLTETSEARAAARALSGRDRAVHVLALRFDPGELRSAVSNPARRQMLAHDLLFLANPDTLDPTKWDPSYRNWDAHAQTLIVSPLEKAGAFDAFHRIEETHRHREGATAREEHVAALVDALLQGPTTHLLEVHWDNKDDTAFDGIVAIDVKSGTVRVLMSNDFA